MGHEGQEGQHDETFQGQENREGMSFTREPQQEEAGTEEGDFNKHSCKENERNQAEIKKAGYPTDAASG